MVEPAADAKEKNDVAPATTAPATPAENAPAVTAAPKEEAGDAVSATPENPLVDVEEKKGGIGPAGGTAAVVGGAGVGAIAHKLTVDHNVTANLFAPYKEALKTQGERFKQAALARLSENVSATDLGNRAWQHFEEIRHEAHKSVLASGTDLERALQDPATVLGAAKKKFNDKHPWNTTGAQYWEGRDNPVRERFNKQAQRVASASGADKTKAAEDLFNTIMREAEIYDKKNAAMKVKELSWLRRINPFAGELHLSGKQRTFAIIAGTVSAVVAGLGIAKLAQTLNAGKSGQSANER